VWKHWVEGTITQIADPSLGRHYPVAEVLKCVNIGLLCVQQNPTDRPSMSAIVVMFGSDTVAVEAPYRPAYVDRSRGYSESTIELVKEKEELCSEPHSSITDLVPR
jgi:type IV secretory pathway protease TraF